VSEADEIIEMKGAGAALDRVDRTEDGVDRFKIGVAALEREQARLQFGELLLAFLKERRFDVRDCVGSHDSTDLKR
jgi:hypothetical protein